MEGFYRNAHIYDTVEKVQQYWTNFRPTKTCDHNYRDKWIAQSAFLDTVSAHSRVCVTLWDAGSNRFIYAADKTRVLGDNSARFTDSDGVDYSMSHFPPGHLDAIMLIQLKAREYYQLHPELIPNNLIINMDCRYTTSEATIHILQQACIVEVDENKNPLLFLSYIHDITHLKKNPSAGLVLTSSAGTVLYNYNISKRILVEAKSISSRERKVLELLGTGYHTKEIAEKLNISPHTVDTHRRNLLAKTCCIDTTALVTYSKMVGLI